MHFILAVTGASGSIYAKRLTEVLLVLKHRISVVFTETGEKVSRFEKCYDAIKQNSSEVFSNDDLFSIIASGSVHVDGMVILPCSMGTLGKISHSIGSGLVCRTADVQLKEKRPLIIVPREMPLHRIHLQNMLKINEAGATIIPPSPYFYQNPQSIQDLVDTVVSRILDHLKVEHSLGKRWKS